MSNWICEQCNNENGELNGYCMFCHVEGRRTYNPDKFFIRDIRIRHIEKDVMTEEAKGLSGKELIDSIESNERMTPQEKLHAKLFYHETVYVKDLDDLTLSARIDEMARIAFEARTCYGAAKAEHDRRKKVKNNDGKPKGFERSVNVDETTTDAINKIKERQGKMSKTEKIQAGLEALFMKSGMSRSEAEKEAASRMGAGAILARIKDKASQEIVKGEQVRSPLSADNGFVMQKSKSELEKENEPKGKPLFNPFAKKDNE